MTAMMTENRKITEKDIDEAAIAQLSLNGLAHRRQVVVTLPEHGQVSADVVFKKTMPDVEILTVVESKLRPDAEWESQLRRWVGFADYILGCYGPVKVFKSPTLVRFKRTDALGIGRASCGENGVLIVSRHPIYLGRTSDILLDAFNAHDGSQDAPAGSAGAKRMTPARTQWEPVRRFLKNEMPGDQASMIVIRRNVLAAREFTAHQLRKAIDKGEARGIGYTDDAITRFYAEENK